MGPTVVDPYVEKPCKRGYHKNMDICMANCGETSGNCIVVDGGSAVACQCKPGGYGKYDYRDYL